MNEKSSLANNQSPFTFEKRFQTDYQIVQVLHKGEISTTYKVKNLLDDSFYAIKELNLQVSPSNHGYIKETVNKILREIRTVANLKSEQVVSYKNSWIEVKFIQSKTKRENVDSVEENVFSKKDINDEDNDQNALLETKETKKRASFFLNQSEYNFDVIDSILIYVKYELCRENLSDFINQRNQSFRTREKDFYSSSSETQILSLFLSICKSVEYLHYTENMLHLNLSPKSIFFSQDGNVKLSKFVNSMGIDSKNSLTWIPNYYSAPELKLNYLKRRSDVYSIGLVLIELSYLFKSEKDRTFILEEAKKGIIPEVIKECFPVITNLLERILCSEYYKRPTVKLIISFLNEYLAKVNKCFSFKENNLGRKRIFSEGSQIEKLIEVQMHQNERCQEWTTKWVKLVNGKLLIFSQKNQNKAQISYCLQECEIVGRFVEEKSRKTKPKKSSSLALNLEGLKANKEKSLLVENFNYIIEVDHPYLEKCIIKCGSVLESLELYNEVSNVSSG